MNQTSHVDVLPRRSERRTGVARHRARLLDVLRVLVAHGEQRAPTTVRLGRSNGSALGTDKPKGFGGVKGGPPMRWPFTRRWNPLRLGDRCTESVQGVA